MADDDEEAFGSSFEGGHWVWDENTKGLLFVSDRPPILVDTVAITTAIPTGTIDFRDDIDVLEQDLKDLAIYTAPVALLSVSLINLLHTPTTDRFIRALILYCQYYLQISEEMSRRIIELESKLRTPDSEKVEAEYKMNLCDLRALVAKEYGILIIGGADTKKFHHMGPQKKRRSLSNKDARLIETLIRMCVQIVWLALSRQCFNKIELEINRMFKSEIFNSVEHVLRTNYIEKMSKEEYSVLLGDCVRHDKKMNSGSPLMNEAFCDRPIDYRMMGVGVVDYDYLPPRLRYMCVALYAPEEELPSNGVVCGILGLPRSFFDSMLRVLPTAMATEGSDTTASSKSTPKMNKASVSSSAAPSTLGGKSSTKERIVYKEIVLPDPEPMEKILPEFTEKMLPVRRCNDTQRRRWLVRLDRLLHPPRNPRKSTAAYE